MSPWIRRRLRRLLRSFRGTEGRLDREIDEELEFHIEMRTRENIASGMDPEEGRRQALRRFGELSEVRRQARGIRRSAGGRGTLARWSDDARQDVGYALRSMCAKPATTALALLALTLGIGSSTAVFSVVDALLLDAFPYAHRDRLVSLMGRSVSRETMQTFRDGLSTLEDLTFYGLGDHELLGPAGALYVRSVEVDAFFLPMLGVQVTKGRGFGPDDFAADAPEVVIISDRLWRDALGADVGALGSTLTIDGRPWVVIGVLPAGYTVVNYTTDALMPLRGGEPREAIGRLRQGATFEQGRVEAEGLAATLDLPREPPPASLLPLAVRDDSRRRAPRIAAARRRCGARPDHRLR